MDHVRPLRNTTLTAGVLLTPLLGVVGWQHSPGRFAVWAGLSYLPILVVGSIISFFMVVFLYSRKSVPAGLVPVPGILIGVSVLLVFLAIDHREELVVYTSKSGLRATIYEDYSGEFGVQFYFAVARKNGELIGESYLGFAMNAREQEYEILEHKGQIHAFEASDPSIVLAWYSPASDRVLPDGYDSTKGL